MFLQKKGGHNGSHVTAFLNIPLRSRSPFFEHKSR